MVAEARRESRGVIRFGHKYGARKTECDGLVFDPQREATRYAELRMLDFENGRKVIEDAKGVRTPLY